MCREGSCLDKCMMVMLSSERPGPRGPTDQLASGPLKPEGLHVPEKAGRTRK